MRPVRAGRRLDEHAAERKPVCRRGGSRARPDRAAGGGGRRRGAHRAGHLLLRVQRGHRGGDYAREAGFAVASEASPPVFPFGQAQAATTSLLDTLNAAIASVSGGGQAAVEITDNGIYTLAPASPGGAVPLAVPAGATLEFRAADGCRPTVILSGELQVSGGADSLMFLNGLVLAYVQPAVGGTLPTSLVHVPDAASNQLATLTIANCTLVPGLALQPDGTPQGAYAGIPTLIADLPGLTLDIQDSILGGIWVNGLVTAEITDTIIDATDPTHVAYMAPPAPGGPAPLPGGSLTMCGCTVVGKVYSSLLSLVSNSVFWAALASTDVPGGPGAWSAALWAARKQEGCVRFSYVPASSILPRNFECVQEGPGEPQPAFVSLLYGDPGYCKLSWCTDDQIRRGADDGGEMGAFHFLLAPLRETDLSIRMQEYIPVGMEFGIYYEN